MKPKLFLLLAASLLLASCQTDDLAVKETPVQVSFQASIPSALTTRASSTLTVDQVVCAVFEDNAEIPALRQVIDIEAGTDPVFAPSLIKGRTYNIVFWAMTEGAYNVGDMTKITRNTSSSLEEKNFDAFTKSIEVTITDENISETVALQRPLAQLNIGVTQHDWTTLSETFGITPKKISVSLTGKTSYNALTGTAVGTDTAQTYTLSVPGADLAVGNETYKSIAMCYVLPEASQQNFDVTFSVYDSADKAIRENVKINSVPLESNYRTNIVGGLLTGTVNYKITFNEAFADASHDKTIE